MYSVSSKEKSVQIQSNEYLFYVSPNFKNVLQISKFKKFNITWVTNYCGRIYKAPKLPRSNLCVIYLLDSSISYRGDRNSRSTQERLTFVAACCQIIWTEILLYSSVKILPHEQKLAIYWMSLITHFGTDSNNYSIRFNTFSLSNLFLPFHTCFKRQI